MAVPDAAGQLSRELVVVCSPDGKIQYVDERAARALDAEPGRPLEDWVDPASHAKLRVLFDRARSERVEDWEVCLLARGGPTPFALQAQAAGETIVIVGSAVTRARADAIAAYQAALGDLADMHRETARQKRELGRLNEELADSMQGLISLHAELDEKNDTLRRSADVKSRLVANVSHEFRTPINSILGLSRLLLERMDGELTPEQEVQVQFIRTNAETLRTLIDDVLDLSKIEAGKVSLRARSFVVRDLMAALRGTMRALPRAEGVDLVIEDAPDVPEMTSDDGKIAQILRNLISNALKFTPSGQVTVTAAMRDADHVRFAVADTGIGIDPEHHETIFEDFVQIDSETQRRVKGTGLGLSLSRRLATLLGGTLTVDSALGRGSTFTLDVPRVHVEAAAMQALVERGKVLDPRRAPVLVVEDDTQTMFLYEKYLAQAGFQVIPARTTDEARAALERVRPAAIVLDVMLEAESSWRFLRDVKEDPDTRDIPVMVVTVIDSSQKARALGADEFWLKPVDPERIRRKLSELARRGPVAVLLVDDDEASRYLVRRLLEDTPYVLYEARGWKEAVALAHDKMPQVILLDFVLGDATAFDVIDDLKANPRTRGIPIIVQTGKTLDDTERERLARDATAILSKQSLSRELAIGRIREALEKTGSRSGRHRVG